jgi:polyisoprenoid-binding protein YceI
MTATTSTTAAAPAGTTWQIDASHSNVEFAVKHLMISTVRGRFADVKGTVVEDPSDPTKSAIEVVIGTASIDTRQEQRDAHLRSADFFDSEKFPTMTFVSRRIEPKDDGELRVTGDLTIRDVTREVVLAVTPEGRGGDPWGGQRAGFSATGKIERSDFGLTWNQALEFGGVAVGDAIKISIDVELVKHA